MQNNLLTVILLILCGILITSALNLLTLYRLKRDCTNNKVFSDERYLDLNLKFQFLITTLLMAGFAIAFLGWNIKSQIVEELKEEILVDTKENVDSVSQKADSLSSRMLKLVSTQNEQEEKVKALSSNNDILQNKFIKLDNEVTNKLAKTETILSIYIVPDVVLDFDKDKTKFYYKDLQPINSDKLPVFEEPPIVNIQSASGLIFSILNNTKDFIEIEPFAGVGSQQHLIFWIVER